MTIAELIDYLQQFDGDLRVFMEIENALDFNASLEPQLAIQEDGHIFIVFEHLTEEDMTEEDTTEEELPWHVEWHRP